jgi:hypothetical protein
MKMWNIICMGYIERILFDNTECSSSLCVQSIVLISVYY